ncbi:MAG TPA: asparagine synthetase B, partial [Flavobacteriia bacterium]|nr:asparagine synthetase B [Flavobacteriia bacterium]
MQKIILFLIFFSVKLSFGQFILIPMDAESQSNHLKAYGITYLSLKKGHKVKWLLNYR